MGGKSIPCLEGSLTDDAEVSHVQVDLCVSFSGLFSHKRLVAAEAEESSIMSSRYHLIHKRIQVRCEQEHQISDPFRKTTPASFIVAIPYLFSSSCYRIQGLLYFDSSIENLSSPVINIPRSFIYSCLFCIIELTNQNCFMTKSFHGPRRMYLVPMNSGIVNGKSIPGTTHLGAQVARQLHIQVSFRVPFNLVHVVKSFSTLIA